MGGERGGVEVAAITAKRVRNPRRNVGRASVLGTALCAVLYLLVSAVVMGLVPHHALVGNGAPFVNAFGVMFPHVTWAGKAFAAVAVVSGIGALNGWTLVTAGRQPARQCTRGHRTGRTRQEVRNQRKR